MSYSMFQRAVFGLIEDASSGGKEGARELSALLQNLSDDVKKLRVDQQALMMRIETVGQDSEARTAALRRTIMGDDGEGTRGMSHRLEEFADRLNRYIDRLEDYEKRQEVGAFRRLLIDAALALGIILLAGALIGGAL